MKDPEIAIRQAELLIKLYELRREPVMRSARSYVGGGEFLPRSLEDFLSIMSASDQNTSYVLQVYGYWDMVSTMVFHGALDEDLVYDGCPEMYFQFAKIRRYIEEFRQKSSLPELFQYVQKLTEGSEKGRARLDNMERYLGLSHE
ncbi:MAG TPA: hypothetical protein VKH40_05050 [Alloacidobacterium sp.]|nr:hypothetical protein [Alloacidobacterium sp.]